MEDMEWSVEEETNVTIGEKIAGITFHSRLNTLICVTSEPSVKILDLQSGVILQKSNVSDCNPTAKDQPVLCKFLNKSNQLFLTQGSHVGLRKEHNGILLLDSALQTTIQADSDVVLVEMPHAEAKLLLQYLKSSKTSDSWKKVIDALEEGLKKSKLPNDQSYHRFTKWATVQVWLPQFDFHNVVDGVVKELMLGYQNIPELSVAASLMDRLKRLLPESVPLWLGSTNTDESRRVVNRSLMFSEVARRETFDLWPHMDYRWAHPDAMAQAGFYHQPVSPGDDRALCFTCHVCLVCWEPTDEPWSEHERHSSHCPYVQGGSTQNVPLSATLATAPAHRHGDGEDPITCVSSTLSPNLIATSTEHGHICIWDVSDQLTLACTIVIRESDVTRAGKEKELKRPLGEVLQAWGEENDDTAKKDKENNAKNSDAEREATEDTPLVLFGKLVVSGEDDQDGPPSKKPSENIKNLIAVGLENGVLDPDEAAKLGSVAKALNHPENFAGDQPVENDQPGASASAGDVPQKFPPVSKSIRVTSMHICQPPHQQQESAISSIIKHYATLVVGVSYKLTNGPTTERLEDQILLAGAVGGNEPHREGEDEAGIGIDVSQRDEEFADNLMGDVVDGGGGWKHCLLVYKLQALPTSIMPAIITEIEKDKAFLQSQHPLMSSVMKKPSGTTASSSSTPVVPENYLDYVFMDVDESAGSAPGPSYFASCVGKSKKQLQSHLTQTVPLPKEVQRDSFSISSIDSCLGGNSLLVVVLGPGDKTSSLCNKVVDSARVGNVYDLRSATELAPGLMNCSRNEMDVGGALVEYSICDRDDPLFFNEEPRQVKLINEEGDRIVRMISLPPRRAGSIRSEEGDIDGYRQSAISSRIEEDQFDRSSDAAEEDEPDYPIVGSLSVLAVLRDSGSVELLGLDQFERLATFKGAGGRFEHLSYCHGMDRLCAVTGDGRASILAVHQASDGIDRTDSSKTLDSGTALMADSADLQEDTKKKDSFIGYGNLTVDTLLRLHELTQFKTLVPRFKATVPPSWNEIHQEQQQRRHPQHLHQRNEDASQHTRTWKLQPDGLSWKEHVIELLLTKTNIGHVDIKFNFLPSAQPPPKIQVALLKQTEKKHCIPVDAQIDFKMESRQQQEDTGVIRKRSQPADPMAVFADPFNDYGEDELDSPEVPYLVLHKDEILCGPCIMESFADMRSYTGCVSLTSRELMACRDRSFLLYIGTVPDPDGATESQKELLTRLLNTHPSTGSEKISLSGQKNEVKGCDLIQKISITVRRTRKLSASLPRGDRFQRGAMLGTTEFHHKLLRIVVCEEVSDLTPQGQRLALDILSWIASVQNCEAPNKPATLILVLTEYLPSLIRSCYVEADRTMAHKCSQLIAQCLGCVKKSSKDENELKKILLESILDWLPKVAHFTSAGALDWFFRLLYLMVPVSEGAAEKACMGLLMETSKLLDEKTLHEHAFLRAGYGLYGTPLDPALYEIHPPLPKLDTSEPSPSPAPTNPYTVGGYSDMTQEVVGQKGPTFTALMTEVDPADPGSLDTGYMEEGTFSFLEGHYFMSGLLEVEPLRFSCCATSDGTQVVKDDQATPIQQAKGAPMASAYNIPTTAPGLSQLANKPPTTTGPPVYPPLFSLSSLSSAMSSVEQQLLGHVTTLKQLKQSDSQKSSQPPTPKNTPFFMTPPLSPPYESLWSPVTTSTYPEDLMSVLNGTVESTKGDDVEPLSTPPFSASSSILQNLVSPPELYSMLIERMHAGARRYAVLDFGHPVLLTDVFFPACKDLGSVTIDVWTKGENLDGRRLAVALDIANLNLVLNDLLDPPVCRYVKITVIGRYGINTARSKIPLGSYYGHSVALSSDSVSGNIHDSEVPLALNVIPPGHVEQFLVAVGSILEDIHCRYSLACSQLTSLIQAVEQDIALRGWDLYLQPGLRNRKTSDNIKKVYHECVKLQRQLVVVQRTVTRLQASRRGGLPRSTLNSHRSHTLGDMSADALQVLCRHLLDTILASSGVGGGEGLGLDLDTSKALFTHVCLKGTTELRGKVGSLLMKGGTMQAWWGEFIAWILTEFFQRNRQQRTFCHERVFMLLVTLGQRSLATKHASSVLSHLLILLANQLNPLKEAPSQPSVGLFDQDQVRWTLLFLSYLLDVTPATDDQEKNDDKGDRWSFLSSSPQSAEAPTGSTLKGSGASAAQIQARLKKQLELHQAKLTSLKNLLKSWKNKMESKNQHWDFQFRKEIHHQASKQVRDIERLQKLTAKAKGSTDKKSDLSFKNGGQKLFVPVVLPRGPSLQVTRGLLHLLLAMDFTCHVDQFMVACKVLAKVASSTVPCITLAEIASEEQLLQLLESCIGRGNPFLQGSPRGPWAFHVVSCLLTDILEGENIPAIDPGIVQEEGAVGGQVDDMPGLEGAQGPPGDIEMNEDFLEDKEPAAPPSPLPGDPTDLFSGGPGSDFPPFTSQDIIFGSTKHHSSSPNIVYQMAPHYTSSFLKQGLVGMTSKGGSLSSKHSRHLPDLRRVDSYDGGQGMVTPRVSSGMDARMEVGLEMGAEWFLRIHHLHQSLVIAQTFVSDFNDTAGDDIDDIAESASVDDNRTLEVVSSKDLLQQCFQRVFCGLPVGGCSIENTLKLWLQLSTVTDSGQPMEVLYSASGSTPRIMMTPPACKSILAAVLSSGHVPSVVWCLLFHTLTLVLNQSLTGESTAADALISDPNLHQVLVRFLSQGGALDVFGATNECQVGPTITEAFSNFLSCLFLKSPVAVSQKLLRLIRVLVEPSGAIHCCFGPMDAQVKLMTFVVDREVMPSDSDNLLGITKHVSYLVYCHLSQPSRLALQSVGESSLNSKLVELIDKTPKAKAGQNIILASEGSRDMLLGLLLRFLNKLLSSELDPQSAKSLEDRMECLQLNQGMTDTLKLEASQHQGYATDSMSDDDKQRSGQLAQQQASSSSSNQQRPTSLSSNRSSTSSQRRLSGASFRVVDLVLSSQETMSCLLSALSQANGGDTLGTTASVSSQLYQLLMAVSREALSEKMVGACVLTYLKDRRRATHISEPLLWFLRSVLTNMQAFSAFCENGGVQILCSNLVQSSQMTLDSSLDLVAVTLRTMEKRKATPPKSSASSKKAQDTKKQFGLINFAPYCTVTSGNLNTTHPESLLHHPTSMRRSRTAWSYHFYPNETWYDVTINLPCAVLLEEVHVNLSSTNAGRCPSGVLLEVSSDGVIFTPVCSPVSISSLVTIRLCLSRPEVVQAIIIRLKKPVDYSVMNLYGIKVLGRPVFDWVNGKGAQQPLDSIQTSVRWLRLLQHCLTVAPLQELPQNLMTVVAQTPGLLSTCSALLTVPQGYPYRGDIESILLRLGLSSPEVGLTILDMLLRNSIPAISGGALSGLVARCGSHASLSAVDIVAQLGLSPDNATKDRVQTLLDWLGDTARVALHAHSTYQRTPVILSPAEEGLLFPAASHVHCVAVVIWATHSQGAKIDLSGVLTKELFSSMYEWSMVLPVKSPLKRASDYVLSAMCQVQPAFYDSLLLWMGIRQLASSPLEGSLTDDSKEDELSTSQLTDDSKGVYLGLEEGSRNPEDWGHLVVDEVHLSTLALASQSPGAVSKLINSGFLTRLADAMAEFCNHEILQRDMQQLRDSLLSETSKVKGQGMLDSKSILGPRSPNLLPEGGGQDAPVHFDQFTLTADLVTPVLNFFTELCSEPLVKNWLGSPEGSIFWAPLLSVLCHFNRLSLLLNLSGFSRRGAQALTIAQYGAIENAALDFFAKCIVCHSSNQKLLAQSICDELCGGSDEIPAKRSLPGFLRRLILRLMLEDERISLALSSSCYLQRSSNTGAEQISHPMYGVGKKNMVLDVRLTSKSDELLSMVTGSHKTEQQVELEKIDKLAKGSGESSDTSPYVMVHYGPDKKTVFETELQESFSAPSLLKKYEKKGSQTGTRRKSSSKTVRSVKDGARSNAGSSSSTSGGSSSQTVQLPCPTLGLSHPYLQGLAIPGEMTMGQIVSALRHNGMEEGFSTIQFGVHFQSTEPSKTDNSKTLHTQESGQPVSDDTLAQEALLQTTTVPSFLQVFAELGGLALLAEHLPHAYHQMAFDQASWLSLNKEYSVAERKMDEDIFSDDLKEEELLEVSVAFAGGLATTGKKDTVPVKPILTTEGPATIPPHSLAAFGLFLRLPGYAEVLLKEQKKARYLLRLMLGVNEDKDGNNILSMPEAGSLPTLPFTALITLLNNTPLATDDGVVLRRMCLETGSIHLVLACLAVLSHHSPTNENSQQYPDLKSAKGPSATNLGVEAGLKDQKGQSYWAKGTGFGTGSTVSGWNAEEALKRQQAEEEHVTCLFRVLSGYIYPHDWENEAAFLELIPDLSEEQQQSIFPAVLLELLKQSCLLPAISSYLRNDSVLDMAQHVPLYCSVLELLRALAVSANLSSLLIHQEDTAKASSEVVLLGLLDNMKNCVDVYNSKLGNGSKAKKDKRKASSRRVKTSSKTDEETEEKETEGLAQLIPEINKTLELVQATVQKMIRQKQGGIDGRDGYPSPDGTAGTASNHSKDDQYVEIMRKLQFDTFEMITEDADGKIKFNSPHHFASRVQSAGNIKNAARARRLAQEAVTLSTSLPLSASSTVFVRCDEDRLDVMKVLITGPSETPYSLGCFEFDVFFPSDYPKSPMLVNLETTGQHSVRFNPNLYNDGKVCLSVLNTWHGRPEEKWNGDTSSFLQVLVSVQSLILVAEPYFNEPGYERSRGTVSGTKSSREYDANIMQATVKWAMLEMLKHPPPCFKEVIQTHFYLKKDEVLQQCNTWIKQLTSFCNDKRVGRTVTHHLAALKRHTAHLQEELRTLQPPEAFKRSSTEEDGSPSPTEEPVTPQPPAEEAGVAAAASNTSVDESILLGTGASLHDIDNIGLMELPMLMDSTEELSDEYDWDEEEDVLIIT